MGKIGIQRDVDTPWWKQSDPAWGHDMKHLRKIDVLMHHANYEKMEFEDAARFIQDSIGRSKSFLVNRLMRLHGYENLSRVDDNYINSVLATEGCHVGKYGKIVKGLPAAVESDQEKTYRVERNRAFFTHLRKTLQLGIAGFVLLVLFVRLAD